MSDPFKVVLVGNSGVGKTTLIQRYYEQNFTPDIRPTVGASYFSCKVKTNSGHEISMNIWDTAGQEKFQSLIPLYLRNAYVCILVFDLSVDNTVFEMERLKKLASESALEDCLYFFVGNKTDLISENDIIERTKDIASFANENCSTLYTTSAKTGEGVDNLFFQIATELENRAEIFASRRKSIIDDIIEEDDKTNELQEKKKCC